MKVKYWIGLMIMTAVVVFVVGLRVGISKGNRETIPVMIDYQVFFIADRLAVVVSDLHEIKEKSNSKINCQLKKIAERQISDWKSCKENRSCLVKVSRGFYAETDAKIADFMALNCGE